jgi:hypothetical protein
MRRIPVSGTLQPYLPVGGIQRGTVMTVGGIAGAGVTTAAFELAAGATSAGEWVAFVDLGSLGGRAAIDAGVALDRCAVVHDVTPDRWAITVGALLDGVAMVCAAIPGRLALGDARRLQARTRERQGILVVLETVPGVRVGQWPGEAALRIEVSLQRNARHYSVQGKGVPRHVEVASYLRLAEAG